MKDRQIYLAADGSVREEAIQSRELLYGGLNGSRVERLVLEPGISVVRKTTADLAQAAREANGYGGILPALPPIYPQLLGYTAAGEGEGGLASLVYEDVGELNHAFDEQAAMELVGHMASWHRIQTAGMPLGSERGQKPDYEEMAAELLMELGWNWRGGTAGNAYAAEEPTVFGVPERLVLRVFERMKLEPPIIRYVLCHGDLHAGNFGRAAGGALKVLDWEHVHRNSPYWDLYHALDMSHPMFPRAVPDGAWEQLLLAYWRQAGEGLVPADQEAFLREYGLFSAVFSLWMLRLIARDIASEGGPWPMERLLRQREETAAAFRRCAERL